MPFTRLLSLNRKFKKILKTKSLFRSGYFVKQLKLLFLVIATERLKHAHKKLVFIAHKAIINGTNIDSIPTISCDNIAASRLPTDTANPYFLNPIHQEPQTSSAHNLTVYTGISSGNFFVSKFHTDTLQYTSVPLAPRSEAKTLIACALRSWVRIPLEA